jgi:phosphotransferase family enzyme
MLRETGCGRVASPATLTAMAMHADELPVSADLVPGNVLVAGGRLAGVLDVGCFGAADPALDLIGAWTLLAAGPRLLLRDALRCTDLDWERGKAWAFQQAMGLVWYYAETNPVMSRLGRVTLDRIQSAGRPLKAAARQDLIRYPWRAPSTAPIARGGSSGPGAAPQPGRLAFAAAGARAVSRRHCPKPLGFARVLTSHADARVGVASLIRRCGRGIVIGLSRASRG